MYRGNRSQTAEVTATSLFNVLGDLDHFAQPHQRGLIECHERRTQAPKPWRILKQQRQPMRLPLLRRIVDDITLQVADAL